ncbi:MAG: hypothetical protein AAGB19_14320 [Cyanobacteria bacterium P01_F01_bin.3]
MELQQRIGQQRIQHIVDSYTLKGKETVAFENYLSELVGQYPSGLIELALVETLIKDWLTIPMDKGLPFLTKAHNWLKQWSQNQNMHLPHCLSLTPSQFSQITGLDAQIAFDAIAQFRPVPTHHATAESI